MQPFRNIRDKPGSHHSGSSRFYCTEVAMKYSYAVHQSEAIFVKNHKSVWKIVVIEHERDRVARDSQVAVYVVTY